MPEAHHEEEGFVVTLAEEPDVRGGVLDFGEIVAGTVPCGWPLNWPITCSFPFGKSPNPPFQSSLLHIFCSRSGLSLAWNCLPRPKVR